ncbi:MAG: hypothetical protein N2039_06995, partial [Gemmataceae bacterium]|nr:hypothetical protein [Gemmataceae bacterium]
VLEVRMIGRSKMKTARTIAGHLRLMARLWRERRHTPPASPSLPTTDAADAPRRPLPWAMM